MRIYYQDAQIRITSAGVWAGGLHYPLSSIDRAWRSGRRRAGRKVVVAALLIPIIIVAELSVGVVGWWIIPGGGVLILAAVLLVHWIARLLGLARALKAVEDIRQFGKHLELWASVAGTTVRLYETDDATHYGQVCRALMRAMSAPRPTGLERPR